MDADSSRFTRILAHRRALLVACALAVGGVAFAGCGDDAQNAVDDAQQQAEDAQQEAQDAIDQAEQDAQDATETDDSGSDGSGGY